MLDLACVACGFVLRTIAGGVAVGVTISPWFLIVAGSASLFMVTGKRTPSCIELGDARRPPPRARRVLARRSSATCARSSSSVAILAYCLWAFEKSAAVGNPAWFELSIVPFVLGILRYALLLEQGDGGAPEELVLSDRVLLVHRRALGRAASRSRCTVADVVDVAAAQRAADRLGPHRADAAPPCTSRARSSDVVARVDARRAPRGVHRARARSQLRRRRAERAAATVVRCTDLDRVLAIDVEKGTVHRRERA